MCIRDSHNADTRKSEENDVQLDKKRCSSDHPNVKAANVAKDRNFRVLDQCHNNSNDHGKGKRNDRQRYRYCDAFELLRDSIE